MRGSKYNNFVPAPPAAGGPFVPLPASAIDMSFATNQYFGGTLATLMNADQTQAIGALLAALTTVTAGSLVISLNALAVVPNGTIFWISDSNTDNVLIYGQSNTTVRSIANGGSVLTATLGSGTFTGAASKIGVSWQAGVGRSLVANNGAIGTNVNNFLAGEVNMLFNLNVLTNFKRLTYWNTKLSNAALAAFTV